jgi:hypothetical protein
VERGHSLVVEARRDAERGRVVSEAFRGDLILLCDGRQVKLQDIDTESGWPIVEIPGEGLVTLDPIEIQEGWSAER